MFPLKDNVANVKLPWMMWLLVLANLGIFVWYGFDAPERVLAVINAWGCIPGRLWNPAVAQQAVGPIGMLFTCLFLHASIFHLLGNMYFLWLFGDNICERMGPVSFLCFYLLAGLLASAAHIAAAPASLVPTIGASGAISGVLGAYLMIFPQAKIRCWWNFCTVDIPAFYFLFFWFVGQLALGLTMETGAPGSGGVAVWAHVGGFLTGIVFAPFWWIDESVPIAYEDLDGGGYAPATFDLGGL